MPCTRLSQSLSAVMRWRPRSRWGGRPRSSRRPIEVLFADRGWQRRRQNRRPGQARSFRPVVFPGLHLRHAALERPSRLSITPCQRARREPLPVPRPGTRRSVRRLYQRTPSRSAMAPRRRHRRCARQARRGGQGVGQEIQDWGSSRMMAPGNKRPWKPYSASGLGLGRQLRSRPRGSLAT